jgi:Protein of unknown function (DUF3667)
MSDVERMSARCDNCGTERTDAFCGHCGQKARPRNPTSHDILHELTNEMLHVDGRIFRSVRQLLTGPGLLTLEYFEGRRVRWVSPIRLYLIFSVAYFVLASAAATRVVHVVGSVDTDSETITTLRRLGFESEGALREAITDAGTQWGPRVLFVLVPMFAWMVGRAWRRTGRHYPHHLYFALHLHAAWFAVAAVAAGVQFAAPTLSPTLLQAFVVTYGLVYGFLAFRTAYGGTVRQVLARGAMVLFCYYVLVTATAVGLAMAAIGRVA